MLCTYYKKKKKKKKKKSFGKNWKSSQEMVGVCVDGIEIRNLCGDKNERIEEKRENIGERILNNL